MAKKQEKKKEEQSLTDFDWDNDNNFFGIEGTGIETEEDDDVIVKVKEGEEDEVEKVAKPKKSDSGEEDDKKKGEGEDEEDDDVPFKSISDDEEEDDSKSDSDEDDEGGSDDEEDDTITLEDALKNELFKHIELPEDEELTPDRVSELVEQEIDAAIEEAFNGVKEQGGEQASEYLKFLASGGNPIDYHRQWKEIADAPLETNIDDDDGQDEIIGYYLKNYTKTDSKDEIKDHLEWLEERGKKKAYAEKYKKEIEKDSEKRKTELIENQKRAKVLEEERRNDATKKIKETLEGSEKIGNLVITKEDKKGTLLSDITKPSVKVGENRYITPLQKKIAESFKDPEKLIQLAKFVMSDFDTTDLELEAATNATKKVKKTLVTRKKPRSQPKSRVRNLSDFFDG